MGKECLYGLVGLGDVRSHYLLMHEALVWVYSCGGC